MTAWYDEPGTPDRGTWWWAVEHRGHPAFYLRALLPGDFAPGRRPSPRHVYAGVPEVVCETCREVPRSEDLEPIERVTGDRGHLAPFREGRIPWPRPTDPASCWLCGCSARLDVGGSKFCEGCASHMGS